MDLLGMSSSKTASNSGVEAREIAISCVRRIAESESYANIILANKLRKSELGRRDKNLVTEIVYGATRMQRALDWAVDRFLIKPPPEALRASLRVGAYQIMYTRIPPHAAVSTTVEASSKRNRGVVNAVLRKLVDNIPKEWPNEATQLSYPDWIYELIATEHGPIEGRAMLEYMNSAPSVNERPDGYVQDLASQWIIEMIDVKPKDFVLDVCAAPGGKSTALASKGANVVAADISPSRGSLITSNIQRLQMDNIFQVTADGIQPCFIRGAFDKVLVDAPCSGLGVLHRRPDARWRIKPSDIDNLAALQYELLLAARYLVKPNGELIYSVCTTTNAETNEVALRFEKEAGGVSPIPIEDPLWRNNGEGALLLPQDRGTDGMSLFMWKIS